MDFTTLTIEKVERKKGQKRTKGQKPKTREFSVTQLGCVVANHLWELGSAEKAMRPAWIAYTGSEQEVRAFTANFRGGHKARRRPFPLEIPKKAPHRWVTQRVGTATVTMAYIPELFHLDPGPPPGTLTFLFMPPAWWLDEQEEELRGEFGERARDVARAAYFVAYIDRRSPLPVVHDLRFHLQLFEAARDESWTRELQRSNSRFGWEGVTDCGLEEPIACHATHAEFETFLKSQTQKYFEEEIKNGQTRLGADRRVLPFPAGPVEQLCLDFAA